MIKRYILLFTFVTFAFSNIKQDTDSSLTNLYNQRFLRGISLQITKAQQVIYNFNIGTKNDQQQPIDNNTVVKIASLSKSFASVALMQLVQQKLVSLTTSLTQVFGYEVINPHFPEVPITLEQVMSHTSSIVDCDPNYLDFLQLTGSAKTGSEVPQLRDLLMKGGKYYGECLYSPNKPGFYYQYANLNYGIIGTVVQKISGVRFDLYARYFLQKLTTNQTEIPTFAAWMLSNHKNLATLYRGQNDVWVPQTDYYPSGIIPVRNVTDYIIGSNGVLFSPQAGLRASVTHLCNYMYMLANKGLTKENYRILSENSVKQILRPRYQFHGVIGGDKIWFQNYGFGIAKTSMFPVDSIINHEPVYGHIGESYGLLSGYYFWKDYTFSYYFTGNLRGYTENTGTMHEQQRMTVHTIVNNFIQKYGMNQITARKQLQK